jgi:hypothetical protein
MPDNDERRKAKRGWLMHPTPEDEEVMKEVKRIAGHMTLADAVRVALRRYRAQLVREVSVPAADLQPKAGA